MLKLVRKDARIKKRPDIGPTFVVGTFKLNNSSRLLSQFRFMETAFLMEPKQKKKWPSTSMSTEITNGVILLVVSLPTLHF